MKIEKLEIRNFGKMQNRTLEFSDGIQLISGENESGKSTVHTFMIFHSKKIDMRILLKPVFLHRAVYWLKMRRLYSEHFLIGIMMITWV